MHDEERLEVDFNVEHGKGDRLFREASRLDMIMEEGLKAFVTTMSKMMKDTVENADEAKKLQNTSERERIEAQEKMKGGD